MIPVIRYPQHLRISGTSSQNSAGYGKVLVDDQRIRRNGKNPDIITIPPRSSLRAGRLFPPLRLRMRRTGNSTARRAMPSSSAMPSPAMPMLPGSMKAMRSPAGGMPSSVPGKAFDTDRYFVICSNVIGGCKGSTGPSSDQPGNRETLWCKVPGHHDPGHGECPETPGRSSRHQPALRGRRRLHGRHAGAPVDGHRTRTS